MRADQFIDAVQTVGIMISSGALIYVIMRLETTIRLAISDLSGVIKRQTEIERRLDALEAERFERTR
jgi:cell division protein FtsX